MHNARAQGCRHDQTTWLSVLWETHIFLPSLSQARCINSDDSVVQQMDKGSCDNNTGSEVLREANQGEVLH